MDETTADDPSNDRIEQFRDDIASLKLKTGVSGTERLLQTAGALLMIAGVLLGFISYFVAGNQNSGNSAIDNLEHNEAIILAITGLATAVVGAAMFLRYSLARFFRIWLLRQMYEGQENTRRLAEQLAGTRE